MDQGLSHISAHGDVQMVDVGRKDITSREAVAQALVRLPEVCQAVLAGGGGTKKGNVLQTARIAGIQAAKRTAELIPLCHQLPLDAVDIAFLHDGAVLRIRASVRCTARTGVEMEALTAASVAALTVYDMLKALSHDLVIDGIELLRKSGGRSGAIDRMPAC